MQKTTVCRNYLGHALILLLNMILKKSQNYIKFTSLQKTIFKSQKLSAWGRSNTSFQIILTLKTAFK